MPSSDYGVFRGLVGSSVSMVLVVVLLIPLAIIAMSLLEDTWVMTSGIGLSQHFVYLTLFATAPLLLLIASSAVRAMHALLQDHREFDINSERVGRLLRSLRHNFGRNPDRATLWLLVVLGITAIVQNTISATNPRTYYGTDVFDALVYPGTFFLSRFYLAVMWCFVYPLTAGVMLRITYNLLTLSRTAEKERSLLLEWFGPDECGGLSRIGALILKMSALLFLMSLPFAASRVTYQTRDRDVPIILGTCAVLSVGYSLLLGVGLHRYVKAAKQALLHNLAEPIEGAYAAGAWSDCSSLLAVRQHVAAVNTYALPLPRAVVTALVVAAQLLLAIWAVLPAPIRVF